MNVYVVCSLVPAHTQEPGNKANVVCSLVPAPTQEPGNEANVVCSLVHAHTQEPGNRLMLYVVDMLFSAMVEVQ